ncbi:SHOCT domain-containing protein [Saccharopolyspora sp. TS4A08]|uniref:SHOCT domain-containing protein n=1 Tax=Saccharopolyspora ipomoeae TaxID=3042027 RepID=A0ABT6PR39_9PSEU|nr:SHOCT domain-containing protein [Saccharopolyspora sp. TS4A08]MDI2030475.1 SHOCT domain-containing protein [Saccharopolyspora sp. TS4A08]
MMFGDGGMGVWGFAFMTANTVLFWVVIVLGIIALVRYLSRTDAHGGGSQEPTGSAQRLLADRFARGEIDEDEYQRRLQVLGERARRR